METYYWILDVAAVCVALATVVYVVADAWPARHISGTDDIREGGWRL